VPTFRLSRHEDRRDLAAFDAHLAACPTCSLASSHRSACPSGRSMHEQLVLDANGARRYALRGVVAPWWQTLDLAQVGERHFRDFLGERDLALAGLEGVDISVWQRQFPWDEAIAQGIRWAIAKASEGDGGTDGRWPENLAALLAPGPILPGSYHFSRQDLGNSAVAEATWYLTRHPAVCFTAAQPWIFAHDAESAGGSAAWCYGFLDTVSSRIGYSCWFYSFASWIATRGVAATNRPLWIAWPNPGDPPNEGWPAITAVQYGSRPFSIGAVDADRFLGDLPTLLILAGSGGAAPAPVPAPPPPAPPPPQEEDDMGDLAYLDTHLELGQQHVLYVDAKGRLIQMVYDEASGTWASLVLTTGLAPRAPVTARVVDSLKQVQLLARAADGRVMHGCAAFGGSFQVELRGEADGGMPAPAPAPAPLPDIDALVMALAAALVPHLQVLDMAKLEADLLRQVPPATVSTFVAALHPPTS
jgi:GH25 family lysozyme M1 (1,4-beta-N-acetylmuramidase)